MRATTKQYAKSFFEAVKEADENQLKKAISNFVKILIKNNETTQIERIIKYFGDFWNRDKGIVEAEITSLSELDRQTLVLAENYIKQTVNQENVIITQKRDKNIIGGIIINYEDKIFDSSIRTKIEELKATMNK